MRFKKIGKLPGQPSALIRVALKDLAAVERSKRYKIDMEMYWHEMRFDPRAGYRPVCSVCLAGAVMAKSLNVDYSSCSIPNLFKEKMPLQALNCLRRGDVYGAFLLLQIDSEILTEVHLNNVSITPYQDSARLFKHDMHQLADQLEQLGY